MSKYVKFNEGDSFRTIGVFDGKVHSFSMPVVAIDGTVEEVNALISDQGFVCTVITLEEFKALVVNSDQYVRVKQRVEDKYNSDVFAITSLYPLHERETWGTQLAQAKLFLQTSNEADAPFLKVLATAEGGTVLDFANAVIAKATAYELFMAVKLSEKRAYEKSLLAEIGIA